MSCLQDGQGMTSVERSQCGRYKQEMEMACLPDGNGMFVRWKWHDNKMAVTIGKWKWHICKMEIA